MKTSLLALSILTISALNASTLDELLKKATKSSDPKDLETYFTHVTPEELGRRKQIALMKAIEAGSEPLVQQLITMGVNVNFDVRNSIGNWHTVPLIKAIKTTPKENCIGIITALLQAGANPDETDGFKQTSLHHAVCNENPEIVSLLLQSKGFVNAQDQYRRTPLHDAALSCHAGSIPTVTFLLAAGADKKLRDRAGVTPYQQARTVYQIHKDGGCKNPADHKEVMKLLEPLKTS